MKKSLDFKIHSANYLESGNFIQRFASAYMFLEMTNNPAEIFYNPDVGGQCFRCSSGGEKHSCKKDKTAAKRCGFFFLFNTMCGNSAIRRRFDGTPTEMQDLIGDTDCEGHGLGTNFTVDFLFGFAGYEYRICTDVGSFKNEIVASIDSGKPVIAKVNSGMPRYYVKTGYDGGSLLVPDHVSYWDYSTVSLTDEYMEQPPVYDEIDVLYIFGDKTERRYTLKDGLINIRRVMEYNLNAGLWDEYLLKLGGCEEFPSDDGLDKANADEKRVHAQNFAKTNVYMYNFCSFGGAFGCEILPVHYLHTELFAPALSALWKQIDDSCWAIVNAGHKTGKLNREQIWNVDDPAKLSELSAEVCEEISKAKNSDIKVLEIIRRAIEILDNKGE